MSATATPSRPASSTPPRPPASVAKLRSVQGESVDEKRLSSTPRTFSASFGSDGNIGEDNPDEVVRLTPLQGHTHSQAERTPPSGGLLNPRPARLARRSCPTSRMTTSRC